MWNVSSRAPACSTRSPSASTRSTRIGSGQQARQVVARGLGDDLRERVVDPGLGAVLALEVRDAGEVVVVVVARDGREDAPEAGLGPELVERVGDEPLVREEVVPRREAVVEDQRVARVVDDGLGVRDAVAR